MPRVLQVIEATIGGARRHLRELSLGLRDAGWEVDVACAQARDPGFADDLAQFLAHGIGVHPVRMLRRPAPLADAAAVHRLAALMRRLQPDLVHAHSTKAGVLARLAARRLGLPVFYSPHCFAFEMRTATPLQRMYREVERRAIPLTACLIACCRSEQAAALELGYRPEQVRCIPNGIPPPAMPAAERRPIYDVAFIGRFCRQKGIDVMLAATACLAARRPGLRIAIMGGGGAARTERRLAALPQVTRHPFSGTDAVARLLLQSRVVAMPSRWEGLPYLLLEALAAGTAVVASGVGGVVDVVTHEQEALVVAPDDAPALAAALERLLDDDVLCRRLAAAGRERVAAFPLQGMIAAVIRAYTGRSKSQTSGRWSERVT